MQGGVGGIAGEEGGEIFLCVKAEITDPFGAAVQKAEQTADRHSVSAFQKVTERSAEQSSLTGLSGKPIIHKLWRLHGFTRIQPVV